MNENLMADDWVPAACTLPTAEQPLRRADFDDLFAMDVIDIHVSPLEVRLQLRPDADVAARAASLAAKETGCCSFFTFDLTLTGGTVTMAVATTPDHGEVLEALGARAGSMIGAGA